jgi:hypothetical protein
LVYDGICITHTDEWNLEALDLNTLILHLTTLLQKQFTLLGISDSHALLQPVHYPYTGAPM